MTFEELKDEISKLENPLSEDWWPQVATLCVLCRHTRQKTADKKILYVDIKT